MGVGFGLAPSWSFSAEYNHLSMGGNTLVDESSINYRLGGYGRCRLGGYGAPLTARY